MAADGALTDLQPGRDLRGVEVLPVGEDDHRALTHAQSGDGLEDLGTDFRRRDGPSWRGPGFPGGAAVRAPVRLAVVACCCQMTPR